MLLPVVRGTSGLTLTNPTSASIVYTCTDQRPQRVTNPSDSAFKRLRESHTLNSYTAKHLYDLAIGFDFVLLRNKKSPAKLEVRPN
jgi:hypothetical protein